jgi:putative SOS response-associated peptidase YedK
MADYHNRMPVILDPRDYCAWLEPSTKAKDLKSLIAPWPAEIHAVEAPKAKA